MHEDPELGVVKPTGNLVCLDGAPVRLELGDGRNRLLPAAAAWQGGGHGGGGEKRPTRDYAGHGTSQSSRITRVSGGLVQGALMFWARTPTEQVLAR